MKDRDRLEKILKVWIVVSIMNLVLTLIGVFR